MKVLTIIICLISLTACATPRPWTKGEKAMLWASCGATALDVITTLDGLDNDCSEANMAIGKDPSNATVILFSTAIQACFVVVAHYFPDFRLWGLGGKTIASGGAALWNSTQY